MAPHNPGFHFCGKFKLQMSAASSSDDEDDTFFDLAKKRLDWGSPGGMFLSLPLPSPFLIFVAFSSALYCLTRISAGIIVCLGILV